MRSLKKRVMQGTWHRATGREVAWAFSIDALCVLWILRTAARGSPAGRSLQGQKEGQLPSSTAA